MLLNEIKHLAPREQMLEWAKNVFSYVATGGNDHTLNTDVRKLIYSCPYCVYKGEMFRFLSIDPFKFNDTPTLQYVLSILHKFHIKEPRKVFSWSKESVENNKKAYKSVFGYADKRMHSNFYIVIGQTHIGLDVYKLGKEFLDDIITRDNAHSAGDLLGYVEDEQEVLAAMSNSVHIVGFIVDGVYYDVGDFDDVVEAVNVITR